MKLQGMMLRPSVFGPNPLEETRSAEVRISLSVEPPKVQVPGRARVVVKVLRDGVPVDGFPVSISSSRGAVSGRKAKTRAGVVAAEIRGTPDDIGRALVRVHSGAWEGEAVVSTGLEFIE